MLAISNEKKFFVPTSRPSEATSALVELGIRMGDEQGRNIAAAFLTENQVSFRVVVRVLADSKRRRQYLATIPSAPAIPN